MSDLFQFSPNGLTFFLLAALGIAGLVLLFTIQKTEWLLYGLLVWFPFESLILLHTPIQYFGLVKYTPELLVYGVALGSWFHYIKKYGRLSPRQPLMRWFVAFFLCAIVTLIIQRYHPTVWLFGIRQLLRFVFVFFIVLFLEYPRDTLKKFLFFGLGMILLEAGFGMVQYAAGGLLDPYLFSTRTVTVGNAAIVGGAEQFWAPGTRVFSTMGRYDQLGSFLALGLIMLFPWVYHVKKERRFLLWFLLAALALVLTLTFSRASWLAAFFGIGIIGLFVKKDTRILIGIGAFVAVLLVYLGGYAATHDNVLSMTEKPTQTLAERMFEAFSLSAWRESYDGYGRIFFIVHTPLTVVPDAPLFGHGPGRYGGGVAAALLNTDVYDKLHLPFGIQNQYGQIDNSWLSIWGEYGTVGLLVWIGIFLSLMQTARNVMKTHAGTSESILAEGFVGLVIGIMILGFFGPYFEFRTLMFYFWFLAGILVLLWREKRQEKNFLAW